MMKWTEITSDYYNGYCSEQQRDLHGYVSFFGGFFTGVDVNSINVSVRDV